MLYLLTDEQKKKVLREYRMRLGIVALVSLSLVGVIAVVSMIPAQVMVTTRQNILKLQETSIGGDSTKGVDELSKKISDISNTASFLAPVSIKISPSDLFTHLEKEAGETTTIRSFQMIHFDENVSVQISGISKNRDTLTKFINILKQDLLFSGASFPYNSLAKQDNLDFTLNLQVNLKNI